MIDFLSKKRSLGIHPVRSSAEFLLILAPRATSPPACFLPNPTLFKTSNGVKAGFTLIELMVVIAIIGILASTVLASLATARRKSRDALRIRDIRQIKLALDLFFDSQPIPTYPGATFGAANCTATFAYGLEVLETPPVGQTSYIRRIPRDPSATGESACYKYASALASGGIIIRYHLGASLEDIFQPALAGDQDCDSSSATVTCPGGGTTYIGGFNGGSSDPEAGSGCADATVTTVRCYDVVP